MAFTFHQSVRLPPICGILGSDGHQPQEVALSGTARWLARYAAQSDALLSHNLSFYGQDTWRITPRLTVTYGLRWDINPPLKGKNLANDPFTVTGLNDPANLALAPRGTPLYQTTYGNVAPRVGLAYQLRWETRLGARCSAGASEYSTILDPARSEECLATFHT